MRSWQLAAGSWQVWQLGNQAIWQCGVFSGTRVWSLRQGEGGSRGSWQLAAGSSIGQLVDLSIRERGETGRRQGKVSVVEDAAAEVDVSDNVPHYRVSLWLGERLRTQRICHGLRIIGSDLEQRPRRPFRHPSALFPVLQRGETDADHQGELGL